MEEDRQYGYGGPGSGPEPEPPEEVFLTEEDGQTVNRRVQPEENWQKDDWQKEDLQGQYRQVEYRGYTEPKRQSNMALASLVMGILGIVTACCCYGGLIFGCLGILFSLLSKMGDTMEGYAKAGLITSIVALVLAPLSLIFLWGTMLSLMAGGVY